MWKWLGGCLLVVIVLIVAASWWGYHAMKSEVSPDGSVSVTIAAPPARVFASLANGDSVATWMATGNRIATTRHGPFVPGDTLRIDMRPSITVVQPAIIWQVTEVVPDRLLGLELRAGTKNRIAILRRDSLVAAGDSTTVISTIVSTALDSVAAAGRATKNSSRAGMAGVTADLMLSMFRVQSKLDLSLLKARIEGAPAVR